LVQPRFSAREECAVDRRRRHRAAKRESYRNLLHTEIAADAETREQQFDQNPGTLVASSSKRPFVDTRERLRNHGLKK
jgi:hypothetical protein